MAEKSFAAYAAEGNLPPWLVIMLAIAALWFVAYLSGQSRQSAYLDGRIDQFVQDRQHRR